MSKTRFEKNTCFCENYEGGDFKEYAGAEFKWDYYVGE